MKSPLISQVPNYNLVEWSKAVNIKFSWDRPWYHATEAPPDSSENWNYPCICQSQVEVTRYPTQDDTFVYLGQCKQCQRIIWRYVQSGE